MDADFLNVSMNQVPANHKLTKKAPYNHPMEKYVLRKAFDCKKDPFLPDEILWYLSQFSDNNIFRRQKEQFSDGVGYSWIDSLKEYATTNVQSFILLFLLFSRK